jgi:hypothetical protein
MKSSFGPEGAGDREMMARTGADSYLDHKAVVLTGHYGSGKTELAVNIAMRKKQEGAKPTIIDLDIANPYFRSREMKDVLSAKGIEVIGNAYDCDITADLPALSPKITRCIVSGDRTNVIDVGGNDSGARILNQYKAALQGTDAIRLIVVNIFRPETGNAEAIIRMIASIENETGQAIQGIINNSNMLRDTKPEHILEGKNMLATVSGITGIPVAFHCYERKFHAAAAGCDRAFPIDLYMRPGWLDI